MTTSYLTFESTALTHVGCVRQLNEDAFLDRPEVGLWVVADGMGGHEAGEVASGLLVESLSQVAPLTSGYAFLDEVHASVQQVNRVLLARAAVLSPGTVIGSTIVILMVYDGHYACLWAGDSRAYILRGDQFEQITRDHSVVQELIDSGTLTRTDAKSYKKQNVITRAVGVTDRLSLDMHQGPMQPGDIFLLCSDGLTGMIEDQEIRQLLLDFPREAAARALLALALDRGAKDNVTLVIVQVDESPDDTLQQTRSYSITDGAGGGWERK